jgi:exodeoxyribonuclease VII small subunit
MEEEAPKKKSFQSRLQDLSAIVEDLERGDLDLEDAIGRFEAGKRLHAQLVAELDAYEKRLEILAQEPDGTARMDAWTAGDEPVL